MKLPNTSVESPAQRARVSLDGAALGNKLTVIAWVESQPFTLVKYWAKTPGDLT